ncbi:MAG TPA: glycosyltransferase [Cytophagales bacterium]
MKVSVCMIAYNHEKYIVQAVESALMQQTNFDYEIVVGEDCSTDGTRALLVDLQQQHPGKIRLLLPERNLGMMPNFIQTLKACRGQYVALLEGDDFWTHPHKLQRQVDFLEANPGFVMCFHNVEVQDEAGNRTPANANQKSVVTAGDIIAGGWFIMTCSILFRNGLFKYPGWFSRVRNGDYALQLLVSQFGLTGYLDQSMGVYRKHAAGASAKFSDEVVYCRALLFLFTRFNRHSGYKYRNAIRKRTVPLHQTLARANEKYPRRAWEDAYDQYAFWLVRVRTKIKLLLGYHP